MFDWVPKDIRGKLSRIAAVRSFKGRMTPVMTDDRLIIEQQCSSIAGMYI